MQACRAHAAGVERIPHVATATRPQVFLLWRPTAHRTSDPRAGRFAGLLFVTSFVTSFLVSFAIQNPGRSGRLIGKGEHVPTSPRWLHMVMQDRRFEKNGKSEAEFGQSVE